MSKGPGTVPDRVLAQLAEKHAADPQAWTTVRELITGSNDTFPNPYSTEQESVRRAVRALARAGKIETRHVRRPMKAHGTSYEVVGDIVEARLVDEHRP
jgi:hypothetical protein